MTLGRARSGEMEGHGAPLAVLLAVLGAACLVAVPFQHTVAPAERLMVSQQMMRVLPGHQLYGTETYPYWERENTGDPEAFADDYIDLCIRNLYPEVGCPGAWDSRVWSPIRDTYDDSHPELDTWPPE
mmetsp:Transcript_23436/g.37761  ORF Transcript_23436/g.37761 Transcript_23436/m.37761 type:complete len:128 (+) Transcript_23436:2-385(+)